MDLTDRHPATVEIMEFFAYDHLPAYLRPVSRLTAKLAEDMVERLPDGPELTFGLRQLLLAKDAFVRQAVKAHKAENPEG